MKFSFCSPNTLHLNDTFYFFYRKKRQEMSQSKVSVFFKNLHSKMFWQTILFLSLGGAGGTLSSGDQDQLFHPSSSVSVARQGGGGGILLPHQDKMPMHHHQNSFQFGGAAGVKGFSSSDTNSSGGMPKLDDNYNTPHNGGHHAMGTPISMRHHNNLSSEGTPPARKTLPPVPRLQVWEKNKFFLLKFGNTQHSECQYL